MQNQTLFKDCPIGNLVLGNQNVFNIYPSAQTRNADMREADVEDVEKTTTTASVAPIAEAEPEEMQEAGKDVHMELYKEAMLQVQDAMFSKETYEKAIKRMYDWYAAYRLGKELGVLSNFEEMQALMQDKRFQCVPKRRQNFAAYVKYINKDSYFPNWQCSSKWGQTYLVKFKFIAERIHKRYETNCHARGIEPYGK